MNDPVPRRYERLSRLHDFEVGRHELDPRGWTVVDPGDHAVGKVRDLVVDMDTMTGRFLDVELEPKAFHLPQHHMRILVPMDRAHQIGDHRRLRVDAITRDNVTAMAVAHDAQELSFWERWWSGDTVRIPVGNEEYVVERRPVASHER